MNPDRFFHFGRVVDLVFNRMLRELLGDDLGFEGYFIAGIKLQLLQRGAMAGPDFLNRQIMAFDRNGFIYNNFIIVVREMIGDGCELFDPSGNRELVFRQLDSGFLFGGGCFFCGISGIACFGESESALSGAARISLLAVSASGTSWLSCSSRTFTAGRVSSVTSVESSALAASAAEARCPKAAVCISFR